MMNYEEVRIALDHKKITKVCDKVDITIKGQNIFIYDRIHINELYSRLKDAFDEPYMLQYPSAMGALTPTRYYFDNDWHLASDESRSRIYGGGWNEYAVSKTGWQKDAECLEQWCSIQCIGEAEEDELFRYSIDGGSLQDFKHPGLPNEAVRYPKHAAKLEVISNKGQYGTTEYSNTWGLNPDLYFLPVGKSTPSSYWSKRRSIHGYGD